jgi:hypothetical protein
VFVSGDGNFRLRRHNKGGGELADPSLFGDEAFHVPNAEYKQFCHVRGNDPGDKVVSKSTSIWNEN